MLNSVHTLLKAPYNKSNIIRAFIRFFHWKMIRLFKLKNYEYRLWGDRKIYLNYNSFQSMWIMYNYIVDWEEFNLIRDYVNAGDHVADVGTNMGFYTIWMSKFVGEHGMIHCFEPDHENFNKLQLNCKLNSLTNVELNKTALSDTDGNLSFTKNLDGENHITVNPSENAVNVTSMTLDTYFKQHTISRFSYVKVDIEGFEYFFLKGAGNLLKNKYIDIIQLEINQQVKNSFTAIDDLLGLIEASGYTLCRYDCTRKELQKVLYAKERENYFAVADIIAVNKKLIRAFN